MARTVTLIGLSRSPYYYTACDMSKGGWMRVAGNYAFLDALDRPVYVGETSDFAGRMPNHPMWPVAQLCGAVMVVTKLHRGSEAERKAEEADLIRAYNPICNEQHKGPGAVGLDDIFPPYGARGLLRR